MTKDAAVGLAEWLAITHGIRHPRQRAVPKRPLPTMTTGNEDGVASIDGMMEPEAVAEACVRAIEAEDFLIPPHAEVLEYMRRCAFQCV